jgi:lipopolysaccharide transport system permease protein
MVFFERAGVMYFKTISSILTNRELIWELALRDLKGINQGAFLGYLWLVINPFVQVAAYVVIVSFVFKAYQGSYSGPLDYALYVLSGMIPWQIMTKVIQESPSLIRERMDLVKQVIYPIETLPLNSLLVSCFGSLVALCLFLVLSVITGNAHWTYFLLPLPLFFLMVFALGISWIFSIGGVIFKDLREIVTVVLVLAIYFSPVLLSESMVGSKVWHYILLNPLSHIIICFRDTLHAKFHLMSWAIFIGLSIVTFVLGGWVITRTKLLINEYI